MTVGELIMKLSRYPSNFKVVYNTSSDYEDYGEVCTLRPVEYGQFRGGYIDAESSNPNAIYIS